MLTTYDETHLARVALPLGGIGMGTVALGGRGERTNIRRGRLTKSDGGNHNVSLFCDPLLFLLAIIPEHQGPGIVIDRQECRREKVRTRFTESN